MSNEYHKIALVEFALRTERDRLRKVGGPDNIVASNGLNSYLQRSDTESKLHLSKLLLDEPDADVVDVRSIR